MKVILYQSNIIKIGGVETYTYNMCEQLSELYDVELVYKQCAKEQLQRLRETVKCTQYNEKEEYDCDICILASSWGGYPENVTATSGEYWQMIHANYKELLKHNYKYTQWDRTTKHICVSEAVKKTFEELYDTGTEVIVIHNILATIKKSAPVLKLISATRLSGEKGYNNMVKLKEMMDAQGYKYIWLIFTDRETYRITPMDSPTVIYMEPTYDIFPWMEWADYGVQLSLTEGYSYFVNECLQYGTPVLVTNFDSVFESVVDEENGYILEMDLSNVDLDKIVNKKPRFKYTPKATVKNWIKLIGEPEKKEQYIYVPNDYEIECTYLHGFNDSVDRVVRKQGDRWIVDEDRMNYLVNTRRLAKVVDKRESL